MPVVIGLAMSFALTDAKADGMCLGPGLLGARHHRWASHPELLRTYGWFASG